MPQTRSEAELASSPSRPSHHNRVNPYAKASAQVKQNLKRTATAAALPSPPTTTRKRKHIEAANESDDDVQKTPTKNIRSRRGAANLETPKAAPLTLKTPHTLRRGRSAANTGAPSALLRASARGRSRSPTPVDNQLESSSLLNRLPGAARQLAKDDQNDMSLTPRKKQRRAVVPPSPSTRQTRSATRNATVAVRDSPNNPFLVSNHVTRTRVSKTTSVPLHKRETLDMVYRGKKTVVPNFLRANLPDRPLSPSNDDYSPSNDFVPKLLFPAASPTPTTPKRRSVLDNRMSPTPQSRKTVKDPVSRNLFGGEIARRNTSLGTSSK